MLRDFLTNFEQSDFALDGFFNVEGGFFAIATDYFLECTEDHSIDLTYESDGCPDGCGRSSSSYLAGHAGDGDGVYTTWRFRRGEDLHAGYVAIFDSNYDLANYAKESLGNESWTELPFELIEKFGSTRAFHLGSLTAVSKLLVGDSGFRKAGAFPAVDFAFGGGRDFEVYSFMESPGHQLGGVPNESRHLTRVLVAVASDYAAELVQDEFEIGEIDMSQEFKTGLWEIQMSHQQTMTSTIGEANFDVKNVALKHLGPGHILTACQAWSWLLWDLEWGYKEADEVLGTLRLMGFSDDPDLLILPRALRGLDTSNTGKIGEMLGTPSPKLDVASVGLPKSSAGLTTSLDQPTPRPKFCSQCGGRLSASSPFCVPCGSQS